MTEKNPADTSTMDIKPSALKRARDQLSNGYGFARANITQVTTANKAQIAKKLFPDRPIQEGDIPHSPAALAEFEHIQRVEKTPREAAYSFMAQRMIGAFAAIASVIFSILAVIIVAGIIIIAINAASNFLFGPQGVSTDIRKLFRGDAKEYFQYR
tara:strand:- start:5588 stop:6055 length:468 start_codon:yes stop_codon:yes gene_type:complete